MLEQIIKEKTSADHLLYVSLKYTKTCDVILNLIERWRSMIEMAIDALLQKAKKKGMLKKVPAAPKMKVDAMKIVFKKEPIVMQTIETYEFFKRVDNAEKIRESEFRKNVVLKVMDKGVFVDINLLKLKEYSELFEKFISYVRHFI